MEGLVLATAHDDVCAYLQPDWCYDVAADTLYLRPTEKPQRPKVSFACDWTHGGLPDARDRRKRREAKSAGISPEEYFSKYMKFRSDIFGGKYEEFVRTL